MIRIVKKQICELCGAEISASNFGKHLARHDQNPDSFLPKTYAVTHDGLDCQFCGKSWKSRNSLCNHERQCKLNPNRQASGWETYNNYCIENNIPGWNKGLTKETNESIASSAEKLRKVKRTPVSAETKAKLSAATKLAYAEGRLGARLHRTKHDRNYYGTYHGFECDSSYELAFVIYNIDHNIVFERNQQSFQYVFEGQTHKYFPDFKVGDRYIEVKGRVTDRDLAKWQAFPDRTNLQIIGTTEIQPYITYCKQKYGNDFIRLYDRTCPSWMDREVKA